MVTRRDLLAVGILLPLLSQAHAQTVSDRNGKAFHKRVLLIGVDPSLVDYTKLPDLNVKKLSDILDGQRAQLLDLGCSAEWCFIDTSATAEQKVAYVLKTAKFDVISIGAGVRIPPENFLLLERVVNSVHCYAPQARICFSKTANDTVEAVQRWL